MSPRLRKHVFRLSAAAAAFLALAVHVSATNTTYYVDSGSAGNDSNTGTSTSAPWKTLAKVAATTFGAGDRILFKAGASFVGQLAPQGSGASGNPIVIDRYGTGNNPIITGNTTNVADGAAVLFKNQQYWEVKNLEITNSAGRNGVKIFKDQVGTSSYFRLTNLTIHDINGAIADTNVRDNGGIILQNRIPITSSGKLQDVVISNCTVYDILCIGIQSSLLNSSPTGNRFTSTRIEDTVVYDCGHDGIVWRGADNAVIEFCVVHSTGSSHARAIAGLWTKDSNGSIIQYCEGYNNEDGSANPDGMAFDFDLETSNNILQYCYSHDNEGGFWMSCPSQGNLDNIVRYNISQNDRDKTIWLQTKTNSLHFYNNTIYVAASVPLSKVVKGGITNITAYFKNNIIQQHTSATYDATGGSWDYNTFYGSHPASEPADAHKSTADPKLVAPGTGGTGGNTVDGYKLQSGSPALGAGLLMAGNGGLDYWANPVSSTAAPNRGAYNGAGITSSAWNLIDDPFTDYTLGWSPLGAGASGSVTQLAGHVLVVDNGSTTSDYFYLTRPGFSPPTGAFTFEVYVKPTSAGKSVEVVVRGASYLISFYVKYGTSGTVQNTFSSPTKSATLDTTYSHRYRVVVHSGYTYDMYVDGVLKWSGAASLGSGTNMFKIGGGPLAGELGNCDLSDVKLGNGEILP